MDDLISRQAAIDAINTWDKFGVDEFGRIIRCNDGLEPYVHLRDVLTAIVNLPSAQPEISRIEQELHGKTPEEQYDFLYWLLLKWGLTYTDSRLAIIEWLRGEK